MSIFSRHIKKSFNHRAQDFFWPRIGWKRVFTYYKKRLFRISDTPHSIAAGLASGVAISFTPFLGLHLLGAAALSLLTRGNVIASVIGSLIGNPITFPFIWMGIYYLGSILLGIETNALHLDQELSYEFLKENLFTVFLPMSLGGVLMAILSWLLTYSISEKAINRYQQLKRKRMLSKRKLFKVLKSKIQRRKRLKDAKEINITIDDYLDQINKNKLPCIKKTPFTKTYNLDDEILLKLSKRYSTAIGDGDDKAEQERFLFHLLEDHAKSLPFDVPVLLKSGTIEPNTPLSEKGFTLWTLISKVHGNALCTKTIEQLKENQKKNIADTLGAGLLKFHKTLKGLPHESLAHSVVFQDLYQDFYPKPFYKNAIDRMTVLYDKHIKPISHLIHGDFSLSNLFFNDEYMLCGISNFYQSQISYPEKDIYRITQELPELKDEIIQSYEIIAYKKISLFRLAFAKCETLLFQSALNELETNPDVIKEIEQLEKMERFL